jgi:hypothetical protein
MNITLPRKELKEALMGLARCPAKPRSPSCNAYAYPWMNALSA